MRYYGRVHDDPAWDDYEVNGVFFRVNPALVNHFGLEQVAQIAQAFRARTREDEPLNENSGSTAVLFCEVQGVTIVGWRRHFEGESGLIDAVQLETGERFEKERSA